MKIINRFHIEKDGDGRLAVYQRMDNNPGLIFVGRFADMYEVMKFAQEKQGYVAYSYGV